MKNGLWFLVRWKTLLSIALMLNVSEQGQAQINDKATAKTKTLYANLKIIQNSSQFLFGQEFFNSFKYSSPAAHGDEEYSDAKAVTGAHPAVLGSDFHYYLDKSPTERQYHTEAVKYAYQQGYAITFDWHLSARGTTSYEYSATSKDLANNIVNNLNGDREWFFAEVDKVIDIINNDLVVAEERIPIVFRPLHEMNGGWFWWGNKALTGSNYKLLYQMLVDYVKERTTSVIFAWSPNMPVPNNAFNYYPGDAYVDVLGLDYYEITTAGLPAQLGPIVDYAQTHGKVAILAETGNRTNTGASPGDDAVKYWKDTVLPAILNDPSGKSRKIAWVLTWINASWAPHPYVAHEGSSTAAKQSFIDFKNAPNVLFGDEIQNLYEAMEVPVSIEERSEVSAKVVVYPNPADDQLILTTTGFETRTSIVVYDCMGGVVYQFVMKNNEITLDTRHWPKGVYFIKTADGKKSVVKKILISGKIKG